MNADVALDRTARLIVADLLDGKLALGEVVRVLTGTRVRIVADAGNLASAAGQHALTTLVLQLTMCGIGVDLDMPATRLLGHQPPLDGDELKTALESHVRGNFPWVQLNIGIAPTATLLIGSTRGHSPSDIVVGGDATTCCVGRSESTPAVPWTGEWPVGPVAAALAAAAEVLRIVVVDMARQAGIRRPAVVEPGRGRTAVQLGPAPGPMVDVEDLTLVSAGAITQAMLYVLLRLPLVRGMAQVFDDDRAELSNLNRYPLLLAGDIGRPKVEQLEEMSNGLLLHGVERRYASGATSGVKRMLIGADDIAVRWTAQRDHPQWLGVGATSHLFAEVSSHAVDTPCVGCVHDHEDEVPAIIPTISVVSGWAGLVLAAELLHDLSGSKTAGRMAWSYPLGLSGRSGHQFISIPPNPRCPVHCAVSQERLSA